MKRRLLHLVVALMAFAATTMAQSLSVAAIEATPGTETTITVNIAGAAEMTALQCNLQLPEGLALAGDIALGDAAKGHTLSTSTLASGDLLIVLYDLYQSTFTDGTLLTIPVVAAEEPSTTEGTLHKVRTSTVSAQSKTLSDVKFTAVVETPAEQCYYYLGTSPDESLITPDNYKEFCQKVSEFPAEQQIVSVDGEYLYVVLPADKDMLALDLNVGIGELNFKYYSSAQSKYIPTKNKNVRLTFDDEKVYVIYRSAATALGRYGVNIKEETPVTSIVLDCTEASMQVGGSIDITATVNPQDATWYKVMWSSDNASVATVDNNGKVTALSEGSTTITAEACDNSGITATCMVTVEKKVIAVSGITLDQTAATLTEGETLTLTATVSPDDATDKTVTWETSDAAIATVVDGVVTAVAPGEVTITAKAGDKEATCVVTVEAAAVEPEPVYAEIENGDYYLQNVGSGKFLVGANSWGTQASLGQRGVSITFERLPNGKYTLDTHIANNATDHYLGANGYVDAPAAEWIIVEPAPGVYALTLDEATYWGYDGSSAILTSTLTDATQPAAQWQLVTRTMLEEALAQATEENPVDATFFIKGADFNRNHADNSAWQGGPVLGGRVEYMCAEKWNTTFDVYQDIVGLPNGHYRLSVQGFYRDGGSATENKERHAILYAGEVTTPLMSILDDENVTDIPNSMDAASALFAAGHYADNSVMVEVTDGTLRIGIRKEVLIGGDWTIFDNFELYYLGTEVTGIESSVLDAQGSQLIYDLQGRRVENPTKGIYIVNGRKVVIK